MNCEAFDIRFYDEQQQKQHQQQHKRRWPCLFVWRIENIDSSQILFPYRLFF